MNNYRSHGLIKSYEQQLVTYSKQLHRQGWVANHDGNITARLNNDNFLATPTGISKIDVEKELLVVVNKHGKKVSGRMRPFSEISLHLYLYRQRKDINVVLHAHPPTATGFAVAGIPIETIMMPEPVVSLGDTIPLIPYAKPGTPEFTVNFTNYVDDSDVFLMQNHGVITIGPDAETAYLRMELVEHLAKIQQVSYQLTGKINTIAQQDIPHLLSSRTKAGLGKIGRDQKNR